MNNTKYNKLIAFCVFSFILSFSTAFANEQSEFISNLKTEFKRLITDKENDIDRIDLQKEKLKRELSQEYSNDIRTFCNKDIKDKANEFYDSQTSNLYNSQDDYQEMQDKFYKTYLNDENLIKPLKDKLYNSSKGILIKNLKTYNLTIKQKLNEEYNGLDKDIENESVNNIEFLNGISLFSLKNFKSDFRKPWFGFGNKDKLTNITVESITNELEKTVIDDNSEYINLALNSYSIACNKINGNFKNNIIKDYEAVSCHLDSPGLEEFCKRNNLSTDEIIIRLKNIAKVFQNKYKGTDINIKVNYVNSYSDKTKAKNLLEKYGENFPKFISDYPELKNLIEIFNYDYKYYELLTKQPEDKIGAFINSSKDFLTFLSKRTNKEKFIELFYFFKENNYEVKFDSYSPSVIEFLADHKKELNEYQSNKSDLVKQLLEKLTDNSNSFLANISKDDLSFSEKLKILIYTDFDKLKQLYSQCDNKCSKPCIQHCTTSEIKNFYNSFGIEFGTNQYIKQGIEIIKFNSFKWLDLKRISEKGIKLSDIKDFVFKFNERISSPNDDQITLVNFMLENEYRLDFEKISVPEINRLAKNINEIKDIYKVNSDYIKKVFSYLAIGNIDYLSQEGDYGLSFINLLSLVRYMGIEKTGEMIKACDTKAGSTDWNYITPTEIKNFFKSNIKVRAEELKNNDIAIIKFASLKDTDERRARDIFSKLPNKSSTELKNTAIWIIKNTDWEPDTVNTVTFNELTSTRILGIKALAFPMLSGLFANMIHSYGATATNILVLLFIIFSTPLIYWYIVRIYRSAHKIDSNVIKNLNSQEVTAKPADEKIEYSQNQDSEVKQISYDVVNSDVEEEKSSDNSCNVNNTDNYDEKNEVSNSSEIKDSQDGASKLSENNEIQEGSSKVTDDSDRQDLSNDIENVL